MRGPLGPNQVTTYKQRKAQYGMTTPAWGFMLDSSDAFLLQGTQLWMDRVVSSTATYGMGLISNNTIGGVPAGTSYTEIPGGSAIPYNEVNRDVKDFEVVGTFAAGSSVTVTLNSVAGSAVPFSTDHDTTMENLCQSIQNLLDSVAAGGFAWIVPLAANFQLIRVISPEAITLALSAAVTGSGAPVVNIREADWLSFVVQENPGSWGAPGTNAAGNANVGVAVGLSNIDAGTPQRVTISLAGPVLTGQTLTAVINGITVSAAFSTNSDATLNAFAAAYAAAFPGASAATVAIPSSGSSLRQIALVAPNSMTTLAITTIGVTGTGSHPAVTWAVTLTGVPSTGSFNFVVYENPWFVAPDEIMLCTYLPSTDGLGNPTGLEYVVNESPNASPRVRVVVNPLFSGLVYGPTGVTNSNNERYLTGGVDGVLPSTAQVVAGWSDFNNAEAITVRILINSGYATPEVHQAMNAVAQQRMDCFPVMDMPSDSQDPTSAANYRMNVQDIDSFWGAIYSPDILIYDSNMGQRRYIPPSGVVAGQYAFTDKTQGSWYSPAGLTVGIIQQALGLRYVYEEGDRDILSAAQVNAIRKFGSAWVIWGEYTLQQEMSALQSVGVVRMMIDVMTEAADSCAYSVFAPNNAFTWHATTTRIEAILVPLQNEGGISDHYTQCDGTNNTPDIIDERVMKCAMWIKPTLSALYIQLDGIVTRQSAVFSVEMVAANNQY